MLVRPFTAAGVRVLVDFTCSSSNCVVGGIFKRDISSLFFFAIQEAKHEEEKV